MRRNRRKANSKFLSYSLFDINIEYCWFSIIGMSSEKNNDIVRKRQEDIDAKKENNEIEDTLNTVSYEDVKESKKEANVIGDSDHE